MNTKNNTRMTTLLSRITKSKHLFMYHNGHCEDLQQTANKRATSSYSLHLSDTTAGIDDINLSSQKTQLSSGSKNDERGVYLAVPTTGR